MTLYWKSLAQSLGLISTGLWVSTTNISRSSQRRGRVGGFQVLRHIARDPSLLISVSRKGRIARSNWRIVEAVLNVPCLPWTERAVLLKLCVDEGPLSYYVRPDRTLVLKGSTRTLVIGHDVIASPTTSSSGERTSTETSHDSEPES